MLTAFIREILGLDGALTRGKKRSRTNDKSETRLLKNTEGWIDFWKSLPQTEGMAAKIQPPSNMAVIVMKWSNIKPL